MLKTITHKLRDNSGFGLMEMAVTLAILGLIFSTVIETIGLMNNRFKQNLNVVRIYKIQQALKGYYVRHGKLPCPAIPGGAIGEAVKSCQTKDAVGYIPFKTLGLPDVTSKNGFNHLFTYSVTPLYTKSNAPHCQTSSSGLKVIDENNVPVLDKEYPLMYVLVDHGVKGGGSFLNEKTIGHKTVVDPLEITNSEHTPIFRHGQQHKIDHKVIFETRDDFMREINKPCTSPTISPQTSGV